MAATGASIPSTEALVKSIEEGGYTTERQWYREWCAPRGYARSTVQEGLEYRAARFNSADKQRVKDAIAKNAELAEGYRETANINDDEYAKDKVARQAGNPEREYFPAPEDKPLSQVIGNDEWMDDPMYSQNEVNDLISAEKSRIVAMTTRNRKLQRQVYDQREQAKQAADAVREAIFATNVRPPTINLLPKSEIKAEPWVPLVVTSDAHIGSQVWGKEGWGEHYDTDIACQRIIDHAQDAADWIRQTAGPTPMGYYVDVGDYFHTLDGITQAGTPLHMDTRAKRIEEQATRASIEAMEILKAALDGGKLYRMGAQGNHDHIYHYMHMRGIMWRFDADPLVEVKTGFNSRTWFWVGDKPGSSNDANYSVHVFDHGKRLTRLDTPTMVQRMRNTIDKVVPPHVQAGARHVYFYCGHLHHRGVSRYKAGEHEDGKYLFRRMPAIAEPGAYEDELRVFSTPGAQSFKLDMRGRSIDVHETLFEGERI